MADIPFELPVHYVASRPASLQDRQVQKVAALAGVRRRHTWYGVKLVGAEADLIVCIADLAGTFDLGRLRPRVLVG